MTGSTSEAVAALVREARDVYRGDLDARAQLTDYLTRLDEPVRIAIAGMVKAGKSTLLNALIGEEIAPTDTGECTKIVTWYRYGDTPRVVLHPLVGEPRPLRVKRREGRLVLDIGMTRADQVEKLVVHWPSQSLRTVTLIDTPGIASLSEDVSLRSTDFLLRGDRPSEADAVVYLMRHMHTADVDFLESFRSTGTGVLNTVNALAVLSRADEVGAGRIDSLLSARRIAQRYGRDETVREMVLGVVPVAGLVAQAARTLTQAEFSALRSIAELDGDDRARMLISVDRFLKTASPESLDTDARSHLLKRFGLFGVRLATALMRGNIDDSTELSTELARRSGLGELSRAIDTHFYARAELLKARAALVAVETLIRERPREGTAALAASVERVQSNAYEYREMQQLAQGDKRRKATTGLSAALLAEGELLIGGSGGTWASRLGLPETAGPDEVRTASHAALVRWRALAESPLTDRETAEMCQVVVRSCEAALAEANRELDGSGVGGRLLLASKPGARARQRADDKREAS